MTSRAEILAAARRIIDRDGWDKLTIRRLAADLGVGPTTLYHHVRDKEDLLIQLINDLADQAPQPELPSAARDRIIVAATAIHDGLAAWPSATVLTTDGFLGRLGPSALRLVEAIIAGAIDYGCTPEQAVGLFRSVWYYTVGEILVRQPDRPPAASPQPLAALDPSRHPHLAAIGDQWPKLAMRDTYAEGLEALVDGLLARAGTAAR